MLFCRLEARLHMQVPYRGVLSQECIFMTPEKLLLGDLFNLLPFFVHLFILLVVKGAGWVIYPTHFRLH